MSDVQDCRRVSVADSPPISRIEPAMGLVHTIAATVTVKLTGSFDLVSAAFLSASLAALEDVPGAHHQLVVDLSAVSSADDTALVEINDCCHQLSQCNWRIDLKLPTPRSRSSDDAAGRLAAPLPDGERPPHQRATPTVRADALALALQRADQLTVQVAGLEQALETRGVIEQAKGMVMLVRHCSEDEAWQWLVRRSQARQEKVRDLAIKYVATATTRSAAVARDTGLETAGVEEARPPQR